MNHSACAPFVGFQGRSVVSKNSDHYVENPVSQTQMTYSRRTGWRSLILYEKGQWLSVVRICAPGQPDPFDNSFFFDDCDEVVFGAWFLSVHAKVIFPRNRALRSRAGWRLLRISISRSRNTKHSCRAFGLQLVSSGDWGTNGNL